MNVSAASFNINALVTQSSSSGRGVRGLNVAAQHRRDILELGGGGPLSAAAAQNMVLERAYARLASVVEGARAELGIPQGAVIDTSPDATAERILNFALGAFGRYSENHPELEGDAARSAFANFIGNAINQGIAEARDILGALNALNPDITSNIDRTALIIHTGLQDFVANGL